MEIMRALVGEEVKAWLDSCPEDGVTLRWFGAGAWDMGFTGEADPEVARQVLCNWVNPDGEQLDARCATVAYAVPFSLHKTVRVLFTDPEASEAVLEAHQAAVKAAEKELEEAAGCELVGVEATRRTGIVNKVVFAANGRFPHGRGWQPLNTPSAILNVVLPAAWKARETYQRRLGEELARRLGVEVAHAVSVNYGLPIAVVQS